MLPAFGITQLKANMFIDLMIPLLRKTLNRLGELRQWNSCHLKEILKDYDDVLLDATEHPIQKPSDNDTANEHYSGKKTHSLKNSILTLPDLRIVWMSQTYEGKIHDKHISSFRVKVEHAIGLIKIFRIVKEHYRCHILFFDDLVFEIACGLHNFKLTCNKNN